MIIPKRFIVQYLEAKRKRRMQENRGTQVFCPICETFSKTFLPFGTKIRQNAQCVSCNSLERHRLIWLFLEDKKLLKNQISLFHVSPFMGFFLRLKAFQNIDYYACDINPGVFEFAEKGEIKCEDITEISKDDDTYDLILCLRVLEYIEEDKKAINELFRIMKPGGAGILQVKINFNLKTSVKNSKRKTISNAMGPDDHIRTYGEDYISLLAEAGFNIEMSSFGKSYSTSQQSYYGLNPSEKIFFVTKPKRSGLQE